MEVIKMLNTDLEVSRVCLGTAYFGTKTSSALSHLILQAYFDNGGNFIDTALQYANWISGENESEKTLGDFLFKNQLRDNVVISTKGFHSSDNGTEQILIDIDKSLANLRTDYIDIYFLHKDHKEFQVSDIIDKLFFAKNDNKIIHFGLSNWSLSRLKEAYAYTLSKYDYQIPFVQVLWNVLSINESFLNPNEIVWMTKEYKEFILKQEINCLAYSSLASGYVSKIESEINIDASTVLSKTYKNLKTNKILKKISKFAKISQCSYNHIALSYLVSQPVNCFPIVGVSSIEQLKENLFQIDLKLNSDVLISIEKCKEKNISFFDKLIY